MPWARTDWMSERVKFIAAYLQYEACFGDLCRNGVISFGTTQWLVSVCLAGERVGLEPCDDGRWRVHFGWVPIGVLDLRRAVERGTRQFGSLIPIRDPTRRRRRPPYGR